MKIHEIRNSYIKFFESKGHKHLASSPLIPKKDKTLMFTNSGMVQFKNVFLGIEKLPYSRVVTSQKCLRAGGKHNDLDNVGYTKRHHTFFEMLGNFSFNDYFKEDAIKYAFEYITEVLKLDKDKLYITVYKDDDESFDIWQKISKFDSNRIIRIDSEDNFWMMGDVGPCGPSTEIFYDNGGHLSGGLPGTKDQDGDRYVEIWNIVFMQYNKKLDGSLDKLTKPYVDTGIGLERLASILQGKDDNYDIDIFQELIKYIGELTNTKDNEFIMNKRIVSDHIRATAFLIADGILPSNEKEGYVLRRIMRRAIRNLYLMGAEEPIFYKVFDKLKELMGADFKELLQAQEMIKETIKREEEKFLATFYNGLKILNKEIEKLNGKILDGVIAFKLYDTYGFPLDLTEGILQERGISVDKEGFSKAMQLQKDNSGKNLVQAKGYSSTSIFDIVNADNQATNFMGYEHLEDSLKLGAAYDLEGKKLNNFKKGNNYICVFDKTCFYSVGGGQVSDTGYLRNYRGEIIANVYDVQKTTKGVYLHYIEALDNFDDALNFVLEVNKENRKLIEAHHSATHLLHSILKEIDKNIIQKGSFVGADKLRFDFNYDKNFSKEMLQTIELKINLLIFAAIPVKVEEMSCDKAIANGAIALFGEKYKDKVRTIRFEQEGKIYSFELCGGTHVKNTSAIMLFKITGFETVASGIKRIEAKCGYLAFEDFQKNTGIVQDLSFLFKSESGELLTKVSSLMQKQKLLEKEIVLLKEQTLSNLLTQINREEIGGINFASVELKNVDMKVIRNVLMNFINKNKDLFLIVFVINGDKLATIICVGDGLNQKYSANLYIDTVVKETGESSGGGNQKMAQTGGGNASLTNKIITIVKEKLKN